MKILLINVIVIILFIVNSYSWQCSDTDKKGPYSLKNQKLKITVPSKLVMEIERIRIIEDVEITMFYRSYWQSYCYQGGALDGNTGCFKSIKQYLPGFEETNQWLFRNKCSVGYDCNDCYGYDSDFCNGQVYADQRWVDQKELQRNANNDHFAHHTCNRSWRCGMKKATFPTFITRSGDDWELYTEYANGTELILGPHSYWELPDLVMRKTKDAVVNKEVITISCFQSKDEYLSCYDDKFGNFIEFKKSWICTGKMCYFMKGLLKGENRHKEKYVNLKAASIEDLQGVIAAEHMLNEELRYNFGLVLEELTDLQNILTKVILSTSKIDDRLMGAVLNNGARSQFVTEDKFFLIPCLKSGNVNSNCKGDYVFKTGRWRSRSDGMQCLNITDVELIDLLEPHELWFPDIVDRQTIGTATNFDGWTYYADEQEKLKKDMENAITSQDTSSISDLARLPKGFISNTLIGFVTLHTFGYVILTAIIIYLYKKLHKKTPLHVQNIVQFGAKEQDNGATQKLQKIEINKEPREGAHTSRNSERAS